MATISDTTASRGAALYAAALGVVLIVGGEQRVSGPSYHMIRTFGGPYGWGALFVLIGAILLSASWRWTKLVPWSYRVAGLGFFSLAVASGGSAAVEPMAGLTGIVTYTAIGVGHIYLAEKQ